MTTTIGMTLDCLDVARVAAFWREAIHYDEPHPVDPHEQFHALVSSDGGFHHITFLGVT